MLDSDLRKLKPETGLWDRSLPHFRLLQSGVGHIALASVGKLSGHTVVMQTHCKIDKGENVDRSNHTALSLKSGSKAFVLKDLTSSFQKLGYPGLGFRA